MRKVHPDAVREAAANRDTEAAPLRKLPLRTGRSTKQMHQRLLRSLSDRRIKRAFS